MAKKLTAEQLAANTRMAAVRLATTIAVGLNKCPTCGRPLRRNLSLAGWYQCEQFGAVGFRKDAAKPSCDWQGFTE